MDISRTFEPQHGPQQRRAHICHRYHILYPWRKICHVEKFQISLKNLNNLWSFIEIYAVFYLNLRGEKSVCSKSLWRKMTKMRSLAAPLASPSLQKFSHTRRKKQRWKHVTEDEEVEIFAKKLKQHLSGPLRERL